MREEMQSLEGRSLGVVLENLRAAYLCWSLLEQLGLCLAEGRVKVRVNPVLVSVLLVDNGVMLERV